MKAHNLWLIIPWTLFIAAAAGWVFYWNYLANEAERRVHAWQFEQNAGGATVEIGQVVRHGFPVFLRLELRDVRYAASRGGWRAETARADLNIDPLKPNHAILEAKAPISITRANNAVTNIRADALIASVRMNGDTLAEAGIESNNLVLDDPAEDGVLHAARVMASVRPDARVAGEYQFSFDAQTISLPRPVRSFEAFGLDMAQIRAAIVVTDGALLMQSSPGDPLGPWRDGGGRLRFEALELDWGPLQTTGTGEGGLDEQRRLDGRLVLPVDRPAPVLTAIANGPRIDSDARRALSLLAAGYVVTGNDITLDIGAHDGVLRVEGLPVRPLPPVY
ncbi:MAG: DUF2125 domain-containing protein [Alphaproteobacteria bacterium]|nr:DUF2125 domain-containing protein [Alphaproteobacteria bacterium]